MPTIILSYRREDSAWVAGRIHDRLKAYYGADNVFMDIDSIPFGLDFREHIQNSLERCDILIAIIGPHWAAPNERGLPRICEESDWVRIEIEAALAKKVPVIPVLVDGTKIPPARDLPDGVRDLVYRQAADVSSGRDFHPHMDQLISVMDQLLARLGRTFSPGASAATVQYNVGGAQSIKVPPPAAKPAPVSAPTGSPAPAPLAYGLTATFDQPAAATQPQGVQRQPSLWLSALKALGSIQGRIPRKTYWAALVASFILFWPLIFLVGVYLGATGNALASDKDYEALAFVIMTLWFGWTAVAVGGKRLHDLNWSAWWTIAVIALALLPLIVIGCLKGTAGPNRFGPDPLARNQIGAAERPMRDKSGKLSLLQTFFSPAGRLNRARFWFGLSVWIVALLAVAFASGLVIGMLIGATDFSMELSRSVGFLVSLMFLYPLYALMAKRLQDRGRPAWMALIGIVPVFIVQYLSSQGLIAGGGEPTIAEVVLGWIIILVVIWVVIDLGIMKGTPGPNRFGPDPLSAEKAAAS